MNNDFSERLLTWFGTHGRHDLAWQQHHKPVPDPYPVWVSEIMLQQTQVATVSGYFNRFMATFPTLNDLANAPTELVLENWAGLGYYNRAKNLHKTAQALQAIMSKTGDYPQTLDDWQALAGIGRSTAGAIMAMGMGRYGVICDGNVKRVLTRHFAIADDITKTSTDKALWAIAERLTPLTNSGLFAQAMMDLGATVCTRTKPLCIACPVSDTCQALAQGTPTAYPVKSKKSQKPTHHSAVLALMFDNQILWLKRSDDGIWANLWCLPLHSRALTDNFADRQVAELLDNTDNIAPTASIRHTLTHFHWQLALLKINLDLPLKNAIEQTLTACNVAFEWRDWGDLPKAVPTAMKKLLQ